MEDIAEQTMLHHYLYLRVQANSYNQFSELTKNNNTDLSVKKNIVPHNVFLPACIKDYLMMFACIMEKRYGTVHALWPARFHIVSPVHQKWGQTHYIILNRVCVLFVKHVMGLISLTSAENIVMSICI